MQLSAVEWPGGWESQGRSTWQGGFRAEVSSLGLWVAATLLWIHLTSSLGPHGERKLWFVFLPALWPVNLITSPRSHVLLLAHGEKPSVHSNWLSVVPWCVCKVMDTGCLYQRPLKSFKLFYGRRWSHGGKDGRPPGQDKQCWVRRALSLTFQTLCFLVACVGAKVVAVDFSQPQRWMNGATFHCPPESPWCAFSKEVLGAKAWENRLISAKRHHLGHLCPFLGVEGRQQIMIKLFHWQSVSYMVF